jgi:hypothetical protein
MEQNKRDVEKEREKVAAANAALIAVSQHVAAQQSQFPMQGVACSSAITSYPCPLPLSPTSMSPFFSSQTKNDSLSNSDTAPHIVTEVFSSDLNEQSNKNNLIMEDVAEGSDEGTLNISSVRRHTFGPSGGQKQHLPKTSLTNFPPYAVAAANHTFHLQDYQAILPHTNLTQYLPLVCNLPPESFSAKDPHLLKPPPVLGADFSTSADFRRRASDGGAYTAQSNQEEKHPSEDSIEKVTDASNFSSPNIAEQSNLTSCKDGSTSLQTLSDSPNHHATLATFMVPKRGTGIMSGNPLNPSESPRKRRTGLHTVMEKPPQIPPELVQEVEFRIQQNQSPTSLQHHHLNVSSIPSTPPYSPLQSQASPAGVPDACSSPPITVTPPPCGGGIQPPPSMISPLMSPSKPGSLRARRTGLSTVMEIGKQSTGKSIGKESSSLLLPTERYSPVRRLSDGSPFSRAGQGGSMNASSMPASRDVSPCYTDVRALQEEVLRLQNETQSFGSSLESTVSSTGYMSPNAMMNPFPCSLCANSQLAKQISSDGTGNF